MPKIHNSVSFFAFVLLSNSFIWCEDFLSFFLIFYQMFLALFLIPVNLEALQWSNLGARFEVWFA